MLARSLRSLVCFTSWIFYVTLYSAVCFTNSLLFLFALSMCFSMLSQYIFVGFYFNPLLKIKHNAGMKFFPVFSCFRGMQMSHKEHLTLLYKCSLLSARFPCNCCEAFAHECGVFCDSACILSMFVGVNNLFRLLPPGMVL